MYARHFGLSRRAFESRIARDGDVYVGSRQQVVLDELGVALSTLDSAVVLTGPAGVGKTTLACAALRAGNTRIALGWLGTLPADPQDLPELLLAEFGLAAPPRPGRVERLHAWRQFLSEMGATESRVLVIVEHADEAAAPVLRTLESLTAADPNGCPGANVVLTGQPTLADLLAAPQLQALRQRMRLRRTLLPLTSEETAQYLRHRLEIAGGQPDEWLQPAAVEALHRYSEGLPRVLNNLCESAFALAVNRATREITADLIVHVAEKLFGLAAAGPNTAAANDPDPDAADLPVLTDAVETLHEEPAAPPHDSHRALLHDLRLEAKRAERLREEELSFEAAAAALARLGADDADEIAPMELLRAGRA